MSSARPREFFFDRSLGKRSAEPLREAGWVVHLIAEHYPDDARDVPDARWIADGVSRGWTLLTKDQRIRYRRHEMAAAQSGLLMCLADGNLGLDEMTRRLLAAAPAIERALDDGRRGFWHVYADGRIRRMA